MFYEQITGWAQLCKLLHNEGLYKQAQEVHFYKKIKQDSSITAFFIITTQKQALFDSKTTETSLNEHINYHENIKNKINKYFTMTDIVQMLFIKTSQ